MESLPIILHNISMPATIIGFILLVAYLVKSIADYSNPKTKKGSPIAIGVGAVVILLCIGLIYVVTNDFTSVQRVFADLAGTGVDTLGDVANDVVSTDNPNVVTPEPIAE